MGVNRTQKRIPFEAICAAGSGIDVARRIGGPSITANCVVRVIPAVRIVNPKLRVIASALEMARPCAGVAARRGSGGGDITRGEEDRSIRVDWHGVPGEGQEVIARACRRRVRAVRKRRSGEVDFLSRVGKRADVTEVAVAFGYGRNGLVKFLRRAFEAGLLGEEEKGLVLIGVVMIRNEKRPADCSAKIVSSIKRGLRCLVKIIAGVEDFISNEFIPVAVKLSPARFCGHQHSAGSAPSILRAIIGGQHLHFLDRVQAWIDD